MIKNAGKYREMGAYLPRGILLVGAPGVGKTLLAKALAGESDFCFLYQNSSSIDTKWVGSGAGNLRELFAKAKKKSPCIIFFDEFDSIGGKRDFDSEGSSRSTMNQLLSEMDGFKDNSNVFVLAATNFPESIDPALLRPGRFDKVLNIPSPNSISREKLIDYILKKIDFRYEVDKKHLANKTVNFTGADLNNMINIAILNAIKQGKKLADKEDFDFALERLRVGIINKSYRSDPDEKYMTAIHEAGHALVSLLNKNATPMDKVTILSKGQALGFTSFVPLRDEYLINRNRLESQIDVSMGGRVAEELFFGNSQITTGCGSDLKSATDISYRNSILYGMGKFLVAGDLHNFSNKFKFELETNVKQILKDSYDRTKTLLTNNMKLLDVLARELVIKETMSRDEVIKTLNLNN